MTDFLPFVQIKGKDYVPLDAVIEIQTKRYELQAERDALEAKLEKAKAALESIHKYIEHERVDGLTVLEIIGIAEQALKETSDE